ncbi:MAG: hypothetical protein EGP67_01040 [Bacteroidales bacterium]|nr:hypothetical protein [Bacteroidales bacterium]
MFFEFTNLTNKNTIITPTQLILVNYIAKHFSIGLAYWRVVGKNKSVKVRKGLATDSIAAMQI